MGHLNKGDGHEEHEALYQHTWVWALSQAHIHCHGHVQSLSFSLSSSPSKSSVSLSSLSTSSSSSSESPVSSSSFKICRPRALARACSGCQSQRSNQSWTAAVTLVHGHRFNSHIRRRRRAFRLGLRQKREEAILPVGAGRLRDMAESQPPEWSIAVRSDTPSGHGDRWRSYS